MVARNSCNLSPDSGFWLLEIASGGKLFSFSLGTPCRATIWYLGCEFYWRINAYALYIIHAFCCAHSCCGFTLIEVVLPLEGFNIYMEAMFTTW
jgi:hypothetical protein